MLEAREELRHYIESVGLDDVTKDYVNTVIRRLSENETNAILALIQAAEEHGRLNRLSGSDR